MTAIFLLFEMTGNYLIIVPLMLTSIIGTLVARTFEHDSIDTVDFSREGIDIHEGREVAVMKSMRVGVAMTEDVDYISERANLNQLFEIFRMAKRSFYFPVVDDKGRLTGIVSLQDIKALIHSEYRERVGQLVGSICNRNVIFLTHEDTLYTAMKMFDVKGIEEIPVVDTPESKWVVGMLKRRNVIAAYNREVINRGISEKAESISFTHS
jgi:CIC family chloride channel protein